MNKRRILTLCSTSIVAILILASFPSVVSVQISDDDTFIKLEEIIINRNRNNDKCIDIDANEIRYINENEKVVLLDTLIAILLLALTFGMGFLLFIIRVILGVYWKYDFDIEYNPLINPATNIGLGRTKKLKLQNTIKRGGEKIICK